MEKRYINKKDLAIIKELDLLSYFKNYEPEELIRYSRNEYGTRTYSSLRMSNGLWTSWANSIGGRSALDFFIKVKHWDFLEAAHYLKDLIDSKTPVRIEQPKRLEHQLKLPRRNDNNDAVINYLIKKRCIDKEIVQYCIDNQLLYEDGNDHSAVFIGYDNNHLAKYACKRGTNSDLKKDVFGSNKSYNFSIKNERSTTLHVFEAAIDLLSFMTIQKLKKKNYLAENYLSIGGATLIGKSIKDSQIPVALENFLENNKIETIILHLDNDRAGKETSVKIQYHLEYSYHIIDDSPTKYKDINEQLQKMTIRKYSLNR